MLIFLKSVQFRVKIYTQIIKLQYKKRVSSLSSIDYLEQHEPFSAFK